MGGLKCSFVFFHNILENLNNFFGQSNVTVSHNIPMHVFLGLGSGGKQFACNAEDLGSIPGLGFPGGSEGKESACNAGSPGSFPRSRRFPREGNGNPLQYSCLKNPMDGGPW